MKIIVTIAAIICMLLMFRVKREYKVAILFLSTMIFSLVTLPSGLPRANTMLCIFFILSELGHIKVLFRQTRGTIIWKIFLISLLMCLITFIGSPHLRDANSIRTFIQAELILKYFALLYAFWMYRDDESLKPTLKLTFYGIIILTLFGIVNYITKTADFVGVMTQGQLTYLDDDMGLHYTYTERFRVQSMFSNPFNYGYICILTLLLHIYGYGKKLERKYIFYTVILCALFGIISCGCRTVHFCVLGGIAVYMLTAYRLSKTIKICFSAIVIFLAVYATVPIVHDTIENMTTMFDQKSDYSGSSIEMRTMQYAAVMYYIQDSPLFGCGYSFFNIDMGWAEGSTSTLVDKDLMGLEGVIMNLLLERGFIGLFLYLIIWISLINYCRRNRTISKATAAFGFSLLTVYLLFANMTGELSSPFPTLLLLGFVVKATESLKLTPPPLTVFNLRLALCCKSQNRLAA